MGLELLIEQEVHAQRESLPGNVRQRIRRAIASLATNPYPHNCRQVEITGIELPLGVEIWRIRMEHWRIVYAINETERWVWVLGLYRRPPYDYSDLPDIVQKLQ